MSTRGGNDKKRGPKYQNAFTYQHNRNSKKTKKIMSAPNEGLCQHCWDKIEGRKKYRKYKPLSQPSTCTYCHQKTVRAAYHKACTKCAKSKKVCAMCCQPKEVIKSDVQLEKEQQEQYKAMLDQPMKERERRTLLRQIEKQEALQAEGEDDEQEAEETPTGMEVDQGGETIFKTMSLTQ